jgi:hypothetical protein
MIRFEFQKALSKRFGLILQPIIPITLTGDKRSVDVYAILDSGADISVIPFSVGQTIGLELDLTRRSEVQGIGEGKLPYVLSSAKIRIRDVETTARIGWALIEEVPLILGRLDVFQNFSIEFREFENAIILTHRNEFTPAA